jgi:hypothetical protein
MTTDVGVPGGGRARDPITSLTKRRPAEALNRACLNRACDPTQPTRTNHRSAWPRSRCPAGIEFDWRTSKFCHHFVIALRLGEHRRPNWKDF